MVAGKERGGAAEGWTLLGALVGGQRGTLTLEKGADLSPGCHTALAGVLAQRHLQEEHRDATGEEEDEVGDEEGSCGRRGAGAEHSTHLGDQCPTTQHL